MAINVYFACSFEKDFCNGVEGVTRWYHGELNTTTDALSGSGVLKGTCCSDAELRVYFVSPVQGVVAAYWGYGFYDDKETMRVSMDNGSYFGMRQEGTALRTFASGQADNDIRVGKIAGWHYYAIEYLTDGTVNFYMDGDLIDTRSGASGGVTEIYYHAPTYIDDAVAYEPPYVGTVSFLFGQLTSTVTAGMGAVEPSTSQEHEVLMQNDDTSYVKTEGDNGYSEESQYTWAFDHMYKGLNIKRILGLYLMTRTYEETATTSNVEIGIDDGNGNRATGTHSIDRNWTPRAVWIPTDPSSGAEFASVSDIENYKFVLKHNISL